jgi:putative restriction endonuclease
VRVEQYRELFAQLSGDRNSRNWTAATRYRAPHKPLMLLAVIDLIEAGAITDNCIVFDDRLNERFRHYWRAIMPPHRRCNPVLPFWHLRSEGFWHIIPRSAEDAEQEIQRVKTQKVLTATTEGAQLDAALWRYLHSSTQRERFRRILLETYFDDEAQQTLEAAIKEVSD